MRYLAALRSFVEVYASGSVTAAANKLGLTQPGVSGHLRVVEGLIGRDLFARAGRQLVPTAVGHDLAKAIAEPFADIDTAVAVLRARSTQVAGTVHIAGPAEYLTERAASTLSHLGAYGLQVRLQFGGRERLYQLLQKGVIDLAFTASQPVGAALDSRKIDEERLWLLADAITAQRLRSVKLDAKLLASESWVAYDADLPLIREYFRQVFHQVPKFRPQVCAADLRAVRAIVAAGRGITVLPDYLAEPEIETGRLALVGGRDVAPTNPIYLVWNRANLRHPRVAFARDKILEGAKH
jgi:DNA-binding transcriptional LysR family regulator